MVKSSGFREVPRDFYLLVNSEIHILEKKNLIVFESEGINFDEFRSRSVHLSSNETDSSRAKIALNCV